MTVSTDSKQDRKAYAFRRRRMLVCWALCGALASPISASCSKKPADPKGVLAQFLTDLKGRRAAPAWQALSRASQAEMTDRAEAIDKVSGGGSATKPADILFRHLGLEVLNDPESISVASPILEDVKLRVSVEGGKSATIRLVRQEGEWKVDLVGALRPEAVSDRLEQAEEGAAEPSTPAP